MAEAWPAVNRPDVTVQMVGYVFQTTVGKTGQCLFDFVWRRRDPLVVGFRQQHRGGVTGWDFSRDLLADGLRGYAGLGNVRVWPGAARHRAHIGIALSSDEGQSGLWLPRDRVEEFLARTFQLVPRGHEDVTAAVDAAIAGMRPNGWVL